MQEVTTLRGLLKWIVQKGPYLVGVQYTCFTQKLGKAVANDKTLSTHEHSNHSWLSLFLFQVTQYTQPFWLLVSYLPEGMYIAQTSRVVFNRAVHLNTIAGSLSPQVKAN